MERWWKNDGTLISESRLVEGEWQECIGEEKSGGTEVDHDP